MIYKVNIKKVATGEIKTVEHSYEGNPIFIWEDGNYFCDCYRALFFGDNKNHCSEGRFKVNITDETGNCIYKEYD